MPCFVVYCKSGYASCKEKIPLFHPPKEDQAFLEWKRAVPKRNLEFTRKVLICAKHFRDDEVLWYGSTTEIKIKLARPRLAKGAVPSIFPACIPPSCLSRLPKPRTTTHRDRRNEDETPKKVSRQQQQQVDSSGEVVTVERSKTCESCELTVDCTPPNTETELQMVSGTSLDQSSVGVHESVDFNLWDEFDKLKLSDLVCGTIGDTKCLAKMTLSSHKTPVFTSVREVRTSKASNQVQCFLLGEAFGAPKTILSSEELTTFTTDFFSSSSFCYGLPPSSEFDSISTTKGHRNILNRWQSIECCHLIENVEWCFCMRCHKLTKLLAMRKIRETNSLRKLGSGDAIRKQLSSKDLDKKIILKKRLKSITKAKIRLMNQNTKLKNEIRSYQEKLRNLTDETIADLITRLKIATPQAVVLKEIIQIAKYGSKNARRYSNDWLLTCLLMHIRSPAMYKFILVNEILPLPSPRTIRRRISSIKIECGFDPQFFEALKKKMNTKTELQKHGLLVFDEVSVRKSLKTDLKSMRYQGVVNFGDNDEESTNKDDLADHALVFGFSSLGEDYFQPVGCFSARGSTKGVILAKLMIQAIILLEKAGIKVCGVVCDGAKPNRRMWSEFGISGKLGAMKNSIENPYDESRKIFFFSDMPHLFKCIRNRLIKHDLMTKFGWARWRHYQVLYLEDRKLPSNIRMCPRLTSAHVYPCSFAKMRVSFMTQIFSKSAAVGLQQYRQRLTEELEDSEPTEKFSLFLNDLFDALNRRYPGEGIKPRSRDINTIQEGIEFLDAWESEVLNGTIKKDDFLTPETAEGLRVTLHSTLHLIDFLFSVGYKYVLTGKMIQDPLEQFFGIVRQAGCQNDHPSLPTFLQLYRLLSTYKLLKPPKFGNCSIDDLRSFGHVPISMDDLKIIFSEKVPSESVVTKLKCQLDSLVEQDDWEEEESLSYSFTNPEVKDIIMYSACGYLCRRLLKMTTCDICRKALLTRLETSKLAIADLVNAKTKGLLLYTNLYLYNLFKETEIYFCQNVKFSTCYERTLSDVFENVNLSFPCDEHKSNMLALGLHYYIVMRMRQYEREENRSLKKNARKKKKESKLCVS